MSAVIPYRHARRDSTDTTAQPLYWVRYGQPGSTPLLALHGGPGAQHDYLLPQMLHLAGVRELTLYDQRGGGRSRTDDRTPVDWRALVDDQAALSRELMPTPFDLLGYSWGGLLTLLALIHQRPDAPRPRRVVLVDPAPVSHAWHQAFEAELARRQRAPMVQRMRDELAASGLREQDPERYRQRAFELSVAGYFADPARARDLTPFRVIARVQQSVWESCDFDLRPDLATLALPVLVIHGREGPIPLAALVALADALPAGRLVTLADCGHVPYVEAPGPLFAAIDAFLAAT